jgi:chain length determinant protein tyrosine kinase EpsG
MAVPENVRPIEGASQVVARQDRRIGGILAELGKISPEDIDQILELQQGRDLRFGEAAVRAGLVREADVRAALARQFDFPQLQPGDGLSPELVVALEPFHPRAEELRALRTQLQIRWSQAQDAQRVLAIVSPGPGEGRSYLAANLAVVFAQLGERTLLVDADLRAPRQHLIFSVPDRLGLSAVLSGRASRDAIVPLTRLGSLALLPAGPQPPNPQELLSRQAFAALLHGVRRDFDVVLIDTPPARHYADAQSIAFRARSAILVARKDHTPVADAAGVIRELGDTGCRILGSVLNAF